MSDTQNEVSSHEIELVKSFNKQTSTVSEVIQKRKNLSGSLEQLSALDKNIKDALKYLETSDKRTEAEQPLTQAKELITAKGEDNKLLYTYLNDTEQSQFSVDELKKSSESIGALLDQMLEIQKKEQLDDTDKAKIPEFEHNVNTFLQKHSSISSDLQNNFYSEEEKDVDHLLKQLAAIVFNDILPDGDEENKLFALKSNIKEFIKTIDQNIQEALDEVLHDEDFKQLESNWRAVDDLLTHTDFSKNIKIDLLDVTKEELRKDFENNLVDVSSATFFKKVYFSEYDQYGGQPYGCIIGMYEFQNSAREIKWLRTMGKIANASHAPFVSSVGPTFFGCKDIQELSEMKDLRGHLAQPGFDKWNDFRDSEEAAYLGFTLPRFMMRQPYHSETNRADDLDYTETIEKHDDYLWANASMLFARNIVKSFATTSWCQTIRGPKNGGKIENLPRHRFNSNGLDITKIPVEMVIPDYRELSFSDCGFMPLIFEKGTANACFFSSKSIKKSKRFKDPKDSENSQLVTNLSYTLSITRIAHYIKCIMRDNIGGPADAPYINQVISNWLSNYVTTIVNPDDLTLRHYPFKAISVETTEREGLLGWYDCTVSVLPHIQFEGLDVELRLEVRL